MKKTKIVATICHSSDNEETIMRVIEAGMDVTRLNFSNEITKFIERD